MPNISDAIREKFLQVFNENPHIIVRSPGRINLIGEHTDYNGGFVLPAAIDKAIYFALSPRTDDMCYLIARDLDESFQVSLRDLKKTQSHSWTNYLMGVLDEIMKTGKTLKGFNLVFGGDLPSGGGVSSSAAIENGIGFALNELFKLGFSRLDLVKISKSAENNFVGMNCGIMDMFASMMGQTNSVIRLDCRSLKYQYFPFNAPEHCLVLCDTGVKHALVDSEYNTRRAECEEGISILAKYNPAIRTLRDVSIRFLKSHEKDLPPIVFRRCKYVVEEISRVRKACKALEKNDLQKLGALMYATHAGLNMEYAVSCPELNFLVQMARLNPHVLGARMMGGGFGGCTINLVRRDAVPDLIATLSTAYANAFGRTMVAHQVLIEAGTNTINE